MQQWRESNEMSSFFGSNGGLSRLRPRTVDPGSAEAHDRPGLRIEMLVPGPAEIPRTALDMSMLGARRRE